VNLPPTIDDPASHLLELYGGDMVNVDNAEMRRTVTYADPIAFALTYLWHHLASEQTAPRSPSAPSTSTGRTGRRLVARTPFRRAIVAPREMGKSTWWFLVIPLWAAAHGHTEFIAAFADAAKLAETHLATFLTELRTNQRIREDYPDLCRPLSTRRGITDADRSDLYRAKSGFVFAARGMESQTLGLKIGALRPDLIILDDIEAAEENNSAALTAKRLATLQDTILPLNDKARFVFVGTVTRADSILHQLVKVARGQVRADDERSSWIAEDRWKPSYYPPILTLDDGSRESIWPATVGAARARADRAHPVVREELRERPDRRRRRLLDPRRLPPGRPGGRDPDPAVHRPGRDDEGLLRLHRPRRHPVGAGLKGRGKCG
jgi:hypothetical protein